VNTLAGEAGQLLARYAWAIDDRRWQDLHEVFASDAEADYEAFRCRTAEELVDRMRQLHQDLDDTQHLIGSVLVEPDGAGLRMRSHVRATLVKRGSAAGSTLTVCARYDDRVRETTAGVRITARSVRGISVHGNRGILPWLVPLPHSRQPAGERNTEVGSQP
jgi:3-phenylpropionate/cinnamic acid dioxygenase small subunit